MTILTIEPNRKPVVQEIEDRLEAMQAIVGGMIQAVYPFHDPVAVICNDEGKLLGLPLNRALRHPDTGEVYDILCGAPLEGETFTSLSVNQIEHYRQVFLCPEVFLNSKTGGALHIFKRHGVRLCTQRRNLQ